MGHIALDQRLLGGKAARLSLEAVKGWCVKPYCRANRATKHGLAVEEVNRGCSQANLDYAQLVCIFI